MHGNYYRIYGRSVLARLAYRDAMRDPDAPEWIVDTAQENIDELGPGVR